MIYNATLIWLILLIIPLQARYTIQLLLVMFSSSYPVQAISGFQSEAVSWIYFTKISNQMD
jgi:hypothetical protein